MNIDSNFRGNVYVVQDNEVVIECVSGLADLANEFPNTIDTKFASAVSSSSAACRSTSLRILF